MGNEGGEPQVILVTDPAYADDAIVHAVEACGDALPRGAFAVQLRDKTRDVRSLRAFAERLRAVTAKSGAWLLINGNPQVAKDVGADGVHLGGDAMTVSDARAICGDDAFISVAAHSDDAVRFGVTDGADAALVSPIFASPGKEARGVGAVRSAAAAAAAPGHFAIYALGGVDASNAAACAEAGATGVAVIRAILSAEDPGAAARAIVDAMTHARTGASKAG